MRPTAPPLDVTAQELEALLESVREALGEAGYQKLKAAIRTLSYVTELLENREATLQSLRRLLCRARSEKTEAVLEQAGIPSQTQRKPTADTGSKKPAVGHGRKGATAYPGAHRVEVPHASLHRGDRCPECQRGKVYPLHDAGLLVRMHGQAPITATVYALEKLRCNLCGEVFTAEAPEGVGAEKYDATTASMIALLRYGSGFPWNRLAELQESLGIPLPVATQCEIATEAAAPMQPAMEELIRQAAQGEVLHNDDTSMPVLALRRAADDDDAERTGVFTSGIVSTTQKQTIALFFTGRQHAGENLADVLRRRSAELAPPMQMCDALSRNLPKLPEKLAVIVGHCLAHARRRFVEVTSNFPEQCRHVLEQLGKIYANDAFRAGLYARVSTHDQQTLPMQNRALREYAARRGWTVVMQVKEVGSGAVKREAREELLEAARRREIDGVLVWRLDRWGRSVTDLLSTLQELEHLGVGFVSLTEALDLTTPAGRAMAGLLAVFAEFEREILRERVRAGLAHARQNGKRLGRPATVALHADQIRKLRRSGLSKSEIARRLHIGRTSVRRLLRERIRS